MILSCCFLIGRFDGFGVGCLLFFCCFIGTVGRKELIYRCIRPQILQFYPSPALLAEVYPYYLDPYQHHSQPYSPSPYPAQQ